MDRKEVRDYIIEFQKGRLPDIIHRELKVQGRTSLINTIIGPRRAGKTYYLYQLIQQLERSKVLYLNMEDTRLLSVTFRDFLNIVNLHTEITGTEPEYIFFDEPQNTVSWERGVRTLFDARKFKIFLTGSSSKLLSSEIATQLRGRSISHLLLPYSFREFLASQSAAVPELMGSSDAAKIKNHLNQWLEFGGYPEVVKTADETDKMKILEGYKDMIIYKDIIERYKVKESFLVKLLIDHLISNFTREFSINSFFYLLKSRNIEVSKKTLYTHLSFLEDSVSVFVLEKWLPKLKEQRLSPKKSYLCDNGLAYRQREEKSKLMENAVFVELRRRQNMNPMIKIYYWKNNQHGEVDFVVKEGQKVAQLIQVTYAESDTDVREREVANLLKAGKELRCDDLKVITWDYEGVEKHNSKTISCIPLWHWLLEKYEPGK